MLTRAELERARSSAVRAVAAASEAILREAHRGLRIETKADLSPVTAADRAAEEAILAILRADWPGASILAEESGATAGDPRLVWIVDPLDGTRGFARGGCHYGPLVGLECEGRVVAGAMSLPALGRRYDAALSLGCARDGATVRLAACGDWSRATLSVGEWPRLLRGPRAGALVRLAGDCASMRAFGDVASLAMLLDGAADLWIEGGVQPWDLAPAQILVEEAGGVFSDFEGRATIRSGEALAGAPAPHAHALAALRAGD
jgi:histidinol-phosphatase